MGPRDAVMAGVSGAGRCRGRALPGTGGVAGAGGVPGLWRPRGTSHSMIKCEILSTGCTMATSGALARARDHALDHGMAGATGRL